MNNRVWIEKEPKKHTDEMLVQGWLDLHNENWFNNPDNTFYGKREQFKCIAEYWLKHKEHTEDYNDPVIIRGQSYWDDWVDIFYCEVR